MDQRVPDSPKLTPEEAEQFYEDDEDPERVFAIFDATRPPFWWKPWLLPWFAVKGWWYRDRPVKNA